MTLRDILLHIDCYPEATSTAAIDQAVSFAAGFGARLSALAVEVQIPVHSNAFTDRLVGLTQTARDEEARSRRAAGEGLAYFTAQATKAGIFGEAVLGKAHHLGVPAYVANRARTRDLCILPLGIRFDGQQEVAQGVMFGSGRPVLVFGTDAPARPAPTPGVVVVAWDGSRCAARALADALPILVLARDVRILTVLSDKPEAIAAAAMEAQQHLERHGIGATLDTIDGGGEPIGMTLDRYLKGLSPDLLVMGAYGHSRLQEFLLGGATEHMLRSPVVPVLMSH